MFWITPEFAQGKFTAALVCDYKSRKHFQACMVFYMLADLISNDAS